MRYISQSSRTNILGKHNEDCLNKQTYKHVNKCANYLQKISGLRQEIRTERLRLRPGRRLPAE